MKKETLEKANDITKEIKTLNDHLKSIKGDRPDAYEGNKADLFAEKNYSNGPQKLIHKFVPIPIKEFMDMYIIRLEKKITKLEEELEQLND